MSKVPLKLKILKNKKKIIFKNLKIHLFYFINVDRRPSTSTRLSFSWSTSTRLRFSSGRRLTSGWRFHHAQNFEIIYFPKWTKLKVYNFVPKKGILKTTRRLCAYLKPQISISNANIFRNSLKNNQAENLKSFWSYPAVVAWR